MNPVNLSHKDTDSHWISVSDLMAGLMMVFLCIAIAMMYSVSVERDKVRKMAVSYRDNQLAIYHSLVKEFDKDLSAWGATINRDTLTITFQTPDAMFATGDTQLSQPYQEILSEFFPRYLRVLTPFNASIEEIRLEGHTSSRWQQSNDASVAYFNNLALSQERTLSVLQFVSALPSVTEHSRWITKHIAAVGYSSSRPVLDEYGQEAVEQSKRVAFRVITNSEVKIKNILEETL
ncbi:OmpA family protein [Pleionea sp. CnH1-48]|uniref:OmpA/MotB family protein n=1 Tax=Pleionea sp. CnH1-48 TaxID=2954494 RepID=UPI002098627B|nr:OmpA family protein [Pleionea sp. CnH1-48]MCO7226357.1 OmpA family protein [Pleionea sp. CnH1-48]